MSTTLVHLIRRWLSLTLSLTTPRHLWGASLFRMMAGANIVVIYLINHAQRHYLFGPNGVLPFTDFVATRRGFSLYAVTPENWYFELVFHLGVLVAVLWMLGVRTVWLTPLNYVFCYSLYQRNSLIWDGGDNMMMLMFIYAMFMQLDRRAALSPRPALRGAAGEARGVLHNLAMLCAALQLSVVYMVSGLSKVQGETWRNGTALYYALDSAEFSWPGVSEWLYQSDWLLTLFCYGTVFFLISFPLMVFLNPISRRLAVCMAVSFHIGIGSVMGLVSFAVFMIAVELMLVSDSEYQWLWSTGRRLRHHVTAQGRKQGDIRPLVTERSQSVVREARATVGNHL